ncbi:DUF305 domain-containing protein [Bounagaea algeriensis]
MRGGRIAAGVLAGVLLGGCGSQSAPVVQPGAPGGESRVADEAEVDRMYEPSEVTAEEIGYLRGMIPHHRQALEMTALAREHASNERVRTMAERIDRVQRPEIGMMRAWLSNHGVEPGGGHGHAGDQTGDQAGGHDQGASERMPGMASSRQMEQLAQARGGEFDRMFLRLMIRHHEGALVMAKAYLEEGKVEQIKAMAQDVLTTQTGEIAKMHEIGRELGG